MADKETENPVERNVVVYSTPTCPYCGLVKTYLKEKGVQFSDYDVSADKEKAHEMLAKSRQRGVPVIDVDGMIVVGFDRRKIDAALSRGRQITAPKSNMFFDLMDQ